MFLRLNAKLRDNRMKDRQSLKAAELTSQ